MMLQALGDYRSRWLRCFNCGERFDYRVLANRASYAMAQEAREAELKSWAEWLARIPQ